MPRLSFSSLSLSPSFALLFSSPFAKSMKPKIKLREPVVCVLAGRVRFTIYNSTLLSSYGPLSVLRFSIGQFERDIVSSIGDPVVNKRKRED